MVTVMVYGTWWLLLCDWGLGVGPLPQQTWPMGGCEGIFHLNVSNSKHVERNRCNKKEITLVMSMKQFSRECEKYVQKPSIFGNKSDNDFSEIRSPFLSYATFRILQILSRVQLLTFSLLHLLQNLEDRYLLGFFLPISLFIFHPWTRR